MKRKINNGQIIAIVIVVLSISLIIFQATRNQSTVTFYTPAEIYGNQSKFTDKLFRVSGLVLNGTKSWNANASELHFRMTDMQGHDFFVQYKGIPPDLFKEGQGVVVEGKLNHTVNQNLAQNALPNHVPPLLINADLLMVKHSEVYDTKKDHTKMREAKLLDSILKNQGNVK
ncbi:MAG: cytochrome c maturation protein CcmE [Bdellovibrionota bacterium]